GFQSYGRGFRAPVSARYFPISVFGERRLVRPLLETGLRSRSFDREAIEAEIDRIRALGIDELRSLWRTTFRASPPPGFTKDLTARFLCWHIQEQAIGGLDPKTAKQLDSLARGNGS